MRSTTLKILLAITLVLVFTHDIIAAAPPSNPKFEEFKRDMFPQVGRKITVVGKLDAGKLGWWLASQNWGFYIYTTTTNRADLVKMNALGKLRGHKVKLTGTLRHRAYFDSGSPLVANMPQHFYFDAAEAVISDEEIPDHKAKAR